MIDIEEKKTPTSNPDEHPTQPRPKASVVQWLLTVFLFILLFIIKEIINYNFGFRFGGGAIRVAATYALIWSICCTFFFSSLFKANTDTKRFGKWIFYTIVISVIVFFLYQNGKLPAKHTVVNTSDAFEQLHNAAEATKNYSSLDYSESIKQNIDIDSAITDIDENLRKIGNQSNTTVSKKDIVINKAINVKIQPNPSTKLINNYKYWSVIGDKNDIIITSFSSGTDLTAQLVIDNAHIPFLDFTVYIVSPTTKPYKKIDLPLRDIGYLLVDDTNIAIEYNCSLLNYRTVMIECTVLRYKPYDFEKLLRAGNQLNIYFPALSTQTTFSLLGFSKAYNLLIESTINF